MGRAGVAAFFERGHGLGPATAASRLVAAHSVLLAFLLLPLFASDATLTRSSPSCVVSGAGIASTAASDTLGGGDSRETPGQRGLDTAYHDDVSKNGAKTRSNKKKDKRPPNAAPTTLLGEGRRGGGLRLLLPQLLQLQGREAHHHHHSHASPYHDSGLAVKEEETVDSDNKKAPGKRRRLRRIENAAKPAPSRAACPAARKTACPGVPDTVCVNLLNDTQNCGTCFNQCPFRAPCRDGKCVCPGTKQICKDLYFNNFCTDLKTDASNCGTCGDQCSDGASCVAGKCFCPKGATYCKLENDSSGQGVCSDLTKDVQNCGKCGNSCPQGATCSSGTCLCPASSSTVCNSTEVSTGSTVLKCSNLKTDTSNCGKCGNPCAVGKHCINGTCPCPRGQTKCSVVRPSGNLSCSNLLTDAQHCGECDIWCPDKVKCVRGKCACPKGQSFCNDPQNAALGSKGQCVDFSSNPSNCGGCGTACADGARCAKGKCQCPRGRTTCISQSVGRGLRETNSTCVDLVTDVHNCGACNRTCLPGGTCSNGSCTCPKGKPLAKCKNSQQEICANLQTDPENCGDCGNSCNGGKCIAGGCVCATEAECIPSWVFWDPEYDTWCCGGKCNPMNSLSCGTCGNNCNVGETCCYGDCHNNQCHYCADLSSSPGDCGSCRNWCLNDKGWGQCVNGICTWQ